MATSQKDVKAGGAFVEISARDKTSAAFAAMRDRLQSLGKIIAGVGAIGATAFLPFLKAGVDRAVEIDRLASELGFATEEMQRFKYAADVAGVSVQDIIKNPEKFKDLLADAPLMDSKTIQDSVAANRAWKKSLIDIQTALTPLISSVSSAMVWVSKTVGNNKGLIKSLAIISAGLLGVGVSMIALSKILAIKSLFVGAIIGMKVAIGLLLNPLLLIPIAIGVIAAKFIDFSGVLAKIKLEFGDTIKGIAAAIQKGDIEAAWDYLVAALEFGWTKLIQNLKIAWTGFRGWFKSMLAELGAGVDVLLNDVGAFILRNDPTGLLKGDLTDEQINQGRNDIRDEIVNRNRNEQAKIKQEKDKAIAEAQKALDAARDKLRVKNAEIDKKVNDPVNDPGGDLFHAQIDAVRGAFRLGNNASQQFGEGTNLVKKQVDLAEKQVELAEKVIVEIQRLTKGLAFQ